MRRPSSPQIERFLDDSRALPLSYTPAGLANTGGAGFKADEQGFWSLNGCRVVHPIGEPGGSTFGFAYGTLTNHAESGEEIFEVSLDPVTDEVSYRIRVVSRPRAALAALAFPYTRLLQARFRRASALAVRRAIEGR
ncbi:MAG TPA: DUF1990 family protein [Vicinamibacterales bacterium]|nr:DUF1990 family protein [Vicinamibacterales bacterium]